MKNIIIYTLPTCPKCKVLKLKLQQEGISYTEETRVDEMQKLGIMSCPAMMVDDKLYKNFAEITELVKTLK